MFGLNQRKIDRTFNIAMENLDISLSSVLSNIDVAAASQGRRGSGGSKPAISQDEIFKNILARERTIQQKEESFDQAEIEKNRLVANAEASQIAAVADVAGDMYKISTNQPTSSGGPSSGGPSGSTSTQQTEAITLPINRDPRYYYG